MVDIVFYTVLESSRNLLNITCPHASCLLKMVLVHGVALSSWVPCISCLQRQCLWVHRMTGCLLGALWKSGWIQEEWRNVKEVHMENRLSSSEKACGGLPCPRGLTNTWSKTWRPIILVAFVKRSSRFFFFFFAPLSLKSYSSVTFMSPYFSFYGLCADSDLFFHIHL